MRKRLIAVAFALTSAFSITGQSMAQEASTQAACLTDAEFHQIGALLVQQAAQVTQGERIALLYDPNKNPDLVRAIRAAITKVGGVLVAEWPRPAGATLEARRALDESDRDRLRENEDRNYARILAHTDVLLWLDSGTAMDGPKRWERLLANARQVRSVHAHWFVPPVETERCDVERSYFDAMRRSPDELGALQRRAAAALLAAQSVRITEASGTDLSVSFSRSSRFDINDGAMSRSKARAARSVRGREEEFPASAIRTTQAIINGVVVARLMLADAPEPVRITFVDNRVTDVSGPPRSVADINALIGPMPGDHFAELVIGMNSSIGKLTPSSWPIYFGSGGGMVQIRIGDNWESGGDNRAPGHEQKILLLQNATVAADGSLIINDGQVVDR